MGKNIMISADLFGAICEYFFTDNNTLTDEIKRQLSDKIDKLNAQRIFSEYKRTPTGPERERLRREYLDAVGMYSAYRTKTEYHEN